MSDMSPATGYRPFVREVLGFKPGSYVRRYGFLYLRQLATDVWHDQTGIYFLSGRGCQLGFDHEGWLELVWVGDVDSSTSCLTSTPPTYDLTHMTPMEAAWYHSRIDRLVEQTLNDLRKSRRL